MLPGQSFFFTDEIPGWAPSLRSTLARIAADTDHPVVRVAHGFYCKRWHQDWLAEWKIDFVDTHLGGIHFAGAGAGAANLQALNLVGWTAQHPCRNDFGCLSRPPRSPWPHTRFVQRNNERRSDLSWAEITLLEAIRGFDMGDVDWAEAVAIVATGDYFGRLRYEAVVDKERLRWGADGELRQPGVFHDRVEAIFAAMPTRDSFAEWSARARPHG